MNWPLFSMIFSITSTVVIGLLIITVLVTGFNEIPHVVMVAVAGFIISIPIAFYFTKKVSRLGGSDTNSS